ncbi:MAG: putative baseplate assembly protein [Syntrophomonas sp.]|nr:putative baseplate assembly protein [Syntrophomonas sp.]
MLPLPELDDRDFQQIVEDARKMIPLLFPGWTDENYHDPGITLIELLAWLTEMQQFYLNRITRKNELKFLKLMGIKLNNALPARTDVTFSNVSQMVVIPANYRLAAGDQVFETTEPLCLLPVQIEKVLVYSEADYRDFTSFNETRGLYYYAFGRDAQKNNQLLIGFDQSLPCGVELSFTIHLYEDYPVKPGAKGSFDTKITPPARVTWKYYGRAGNDIGWNRLHILLDDTSNLYQSGVIKFSVPEQMEAARFSQALERSRFWIGCFLEDDIYELPPRVEDICLNTVPVVQHSTLSEVHEFSGNGESSLEIRLASSVALHGINEIQIRNEDGDWVFWQEIADITRAEAGERVFSLMRNEGQELIIRFGDGNGGMIPPAGHENIRVISFPESFKEQRWLGSSNGLPDQSFQLSVHPLLNNGFRLQVGKRTQDSGEMLWQDWQEVDDFAASRSHDRHYLLDEETGLIQFGNHENGIIPEQDDQPNLLLIGCKTGGGIMGNVKDYEINRVLENEPWLNMIQVANHRAAQGGRPKETLAEARRRLKLQLRIPERAVSAADFEDLALRTPGLRVARVKTVPLYKPGMRNYPDKVAPAQVTVAVMPYSEATTPIPSPGFKETVYHHLNNHRLLSTELHVVAPDYVRISIYASVVVTPGTVSGLEKIIRELNLFLQPLDRGDLSRGWPFGRKVYRGDIYEVINRVAGVEYVKELWINAEGNQITREVGGDIKIPPCGLVYPGEHEIEIINRNDL